MIGEGGLNRIAVFGWGFEKKSAGSKLAVMLSRDQISEFFVT